MEEINTKEKLNRVIEEKRTFDMMNMEYISPDDNVVIDFVGNYVIPIPELPINFGKELSVEVMLREILKKYRITR